MADKSIDQWLLIGTQVLQAQEEFEAKTKNALRKVLREKHQALDQLEKVCLNCPSCIKNTQ